MQQYIILLLLIILPGTYVYGQKNLTKNDDYTSLYILDPDKNKDFEISLSIVVMFTLDAKDREGIRFGGGVNFSKYIGDFKISTGADFYKAKQDFGIGTTYAGIIYNDGKYGTSYYLNKYFQGDKQISGIVGIYLHEVEIRFEDDILSLPFSGFKIYDRYRTAALEIRYKHFLLGTNVYTNEVNGLTDLSNENKKGTYLTSKQISSPIYIGYTNKNLILRYGINSKIGGYIGQNWWHQRLFDTSDYKYDNYFNQFLQIGTDKPYTLY